LLESSLKPRVLVVCTARFWDAAVPSIRSGLARLREHEATVRIEMTPLPESDARKLTSAIVGLPEDDEVVSAIAQESRGHAFLLSELAEHVHRRDASISAPSDLDAVVRARIERIDADLQRVLELVCVAGSPVSQRVLTRVLGDLFVTRFGSFTLQMRPSRFVPLLNFTGRFGQDVDVLNLRRGSGGDVTASATVRPTPHVDVTVTRSLGYHTARPRQSAQPPVCGPCCGSSARFQSKVPRDQLFDAPMMSLSVIHPSTSAYFGCHSPPEHSVSHASLSGWASWTGDCAATSPS
jgi:hypothetical protein